MSDTVENFDFYARQLLNKSKTNPLRERMQEFASKHGGTTDLKQLREAAGGEGENLSEIVRENREERL
jgi:hypothetical protein